MKRASFVVFLLFLVVVFTLPTSALAATKPGVKPGSFFYFFDTAFERVNLFFTFSPEKKAKKALVYADERLTEAEALAEGKNTNAIKTAVANYESNIALAAEESKQIKDKEKAEGLFASIADNTSKHQEILSDVLSKVPDDAKEAITKAIEASRKGQEEATRQIAELKGEVEQLKKEVAELKAKEETDTKTSEELDNQKSKNTFTLTKSQTSPVSETTQTPKSTTPPSSPPTPTAVDICSNIEGAQSYIPNGMTRNANGNCIVPPASPPTPTPATPIPSIIVPYINRPDNLDIGGTVEAIATVKDQNGNSVPNQTVIFENNNRVQTGITDQSGVAKTKFIYGETLGPHGSVVADPIVYMKVLVPGTTNTFIKATGKMF